MTKYYSKRNHWDLGVILYELTLLKHSFICEDIEKVQKNISDGNITILRNFKYKKELINLIFKLLKIDPDDRLEINQLFD